MNKILKIFAIVLFASILAGCISSSPVIDDFSLQDRKSTGMISGIDQLKFFYKQIKLIK